MKKIFGRVLVMICVFLAIGSMSAAIGQDSAKKILRVNGAGMASDPVDKWSKQFMEKTSEVNVTVIGSSAGKGFQSFLDGTADIAMMSREIRPDERKKAGEKGLQIAERPIGQAAIALITHPRNPVNELTLDQVRKLYTGEYDNWKLVGGADEPVRCLSRKIPESGGAVFFWEKVLGGEPFGSKIVLTETWDTIIKICAVAQDLPIGIIPSTRNTGGVKVLRLKRDEVSPSVAPSEEDVKSQTYPIILSFGFVWNAQSKDPAVQNFVDFCQSQGRTK